LTAYLRAPELADLVRKIVTLNPGPLHLPGGVFSDNEVGGLVNGSLWTLRYEMMMYAMVLLLGVARLLRPSAALVLVAVGIAAVYFEKALTPFGDIGEWAWLVGFFAAGMVLYFWRDRPIFDWRIVLLACVALVGFTWAGRLIMLFPLAGSYLAIWFARRYDRWLDYPRYFGDVSYGLYIYGWPAEQFVAWLCGGVAPWWVVFLGSLAIAGPAAFLSWHGIEKPALRWARHGPQIQAGRRRGLAGHPAAP
jgi:peptidoglycan/LPS O-acetylase OafA/YrhL